MLIHGAEIVVHPDAPPVFRDLRHPREVFDRWGVERPRGSRRSAVRELALPEGGMFLKVYSYSGPWRLRTVFIVSRAGREYRNLLRMAELGFRVPVPVAWGQARTLGFVSDSFLVTRAVGDAVDLRTLINDPGAMPLPPPAERRRLIEEFARTLRRAHDQAFFVHTLRFKNLLLQRRDGKYALYVIDVPFAGIWRYRLFPAAGRVRDLAVLMRGARQLLSRTERMRFARAYGADRELLRRARAFQERHYP